MNIDPKLAEVALEHCNEADFERFGQAFLAAILGVEFVPAGGMHDGGLDGFESPPLETSGSATSFYQITKTQDHRRKVRQTFARLRESGRDCRQLTLLTSRSIPNLDQEEQELSEKLQCAMRLRDRKWVIANVNVSAATIGAFNAHLAHATAFLSTLGVAKIANRLGDETSRTAFVFLSQEVERRRGDTQLLEAVTDSLILWALDGTDPDLGVFRGRGEIRARILQVFPSAKQFLPGVLDNRLEELARKSAVGGRQIRWHQKEDKFCLPFETRALIERENVEDEALRIEVDDGFGERAVAYAKATSQEIDISTVVEAAKRSIDRVFEAQGLDVAAFLSEATPPATHGLSVADQVDHVLQEMSISGDLAARTKDAVVQILRGAFYSSTPLERRYFGKLCRTYTLLLSLKSEPRIVEYFRTMTTRLHLLVGSDLLVLALSEYFLLKEDQMVTNMLRVAEQAGAKLILCEPVLQEVLGQFRASDGEFRAIFAGVEPHVTRDLARHAHRILVRSYFYAKADASERVPTSWPAFVENFLSYKDLQRPTAAVGLRRYLCDRFSMEFVSLEEMRNGVSEGKLQSLAVRLKDTKVGERSEQRALNDAIMVLSVYAQRRRNGELGGGNPYGFTTWWLTKESRIRAATVQLVKEEGARFMMVPEFLLNFIALVPTAVEVRRTFEEVFPSRLGIRLSNRLREDVFKDVMRKAKEAGGADPDRLRAKVAELADKLKGDRFRQYEQNLGIPTQ